MSDKKITSLCVHKNKKIKKTIGFTYSQYIGANISLNA